VLDRDGAGAFGTEVTGGCGVFVAVAVGGVSCPAARPPPAVMVRLLLTAAVRVPEVAVNVYVPAVLILQPEKMATPEEVLLGLDAQLRRAPPAGGVIVSRTEGPLVVTVLPPTS
jgi:hypothetical protein